MSNNIPQFSLCMMTSSNRNIYRDISYCPEISLIRTTYVHTGNISDIYLALCDYGSVYHDDVIKWKHFPRYWPFVRGIHRLPVNSPHKSQWRGALMFSLICALNKRSSKQPWGWWFETSSRSLWRHCKATFQFMVSTVAKDYIHSAITRLKCI